MRSAPAKVRTVADLVVFHFAWLGIVWGGGHGVPALVAISLLAQMIVHLGLSPFPGREALWALVVGGLGWGLDSLLGITGVYVFPSAFAPVWLLCLWIAFATTIEPGLTWFRDRLAWAAVLGAVAGPFSYEMGARLGALHWGVPPPVGWGVLALVWAVALPLMVRFSVQGVGSKSSA